MVVYQIAETLGMWPDEVRSRVNSVELCEWAAYLNGPFSTRTREHMMNAWLVHTIRSIVADKRRKPKFTDSAFPFDKIYREFFAKTSGAPKPPARGKRKPTTVGEVLHGSQILRKRFEKALADYKAGKSVNILGLRYGERLKV